MEMPRQYPVQRRGNFGRLVREDELAEAYDDVSLSMNHRTVCLGRAASSPGMSEGSLHAIAAHGKGGGGGKHSAGPSSGRQDR